MKSILILLFLFLSANSVFAETKRLVGKGLYGTDDRVLSRDLNKKRDKKIIIASRSVLAQVPKWQFSSTVDNKVLMTAKSLGLGYNVCSDERFLDEPLVASCTAFLIAPDVILTAGHCVDSKIDCHNSHWILDFDDQQDFKAPYSDISFKTDKIYKCKELISSSNTTKLDYALVRLDRPITDRAPLKMNTEGTLNQKSSLYVVGHPLGMPKTVAKNAFVSRNTNADYFITNTDTFHGNSGSPVINLKTNLVEGVLIRGDEDMTFDTKRSCRAITRCQDYECRGETAQRIQKIPLSSLSK